jgi:hypothetical protein
MTQFLAEDLGMYVDYGPGPNKHTWGAALLSKFPIINSTHHLLPSPVGELAPAIHATLDIYGHMIDVIVSHNGTATYVWANWQVRKKILRTVAYKQQNCPELCVNHHVHSCSWDTLLQNHIKEIIIF